MPRLEVRDPLTEVSWAQKTLSCEIIEIFTASLIHMIMWRAFETSTKLTLSEEKVFR